MGVKTRLGLTILAAAFALGILADGLLRGVLPGVNVLLWTGALVLTMIALARRSGTEAAPDTLWLAPSILLFAALFAWRASPALQLLNGLALLTLLAIAAARSRSGRVHVAGATDYFVYTIEAGVDACWGTLKLVGDDIRWREVPKQGWGSRLTALTRGVLIALPFLLLFGSLFMSADGAFERMVTRAFTFDLSGVSITALFTLGAAWAAAGYLRRLFLVEPPAAPAGDEAVPRAAGFSLGPIEITTALGLLDLLFLSFVLVQARYFFGGQEVVRSTEGLTSAEYARRGFFELAAVAALALPMLLFLHWLQDERAGRSRLFPLLGGGMVALLFAIMASAVQRMLLYQASFGMTELRFYVTSFIGWMAAVFAWFAATVLCGRRDRFAFGALVSALAVVLTLQVMDPDALIVRSNAAHVRKGAAFDVEYALSLSDDALPAVIELLPRLQPSLRDEALQIISQRKPEAPGDWRAWNWGRVQARRARSALPAASTGDDGEFREYGPAPLVGTHGSGTSSPWRRSGAWPKPVRLRAATAWNVVR